MMIKPVNLPKAQILIFGGRIKMRDLKIILGYPISKQLIALFHILEMWFFLFVRDFKLKV